MTMSSFNLKGSWTQFFKEAGIPSSAAKSYSVIFEDNRITKDLLPDLSKEILSDMGIKVMGDIICILKHAKKEVRKSERYGSDSGQVAPGGVPLAHSTTSAHPDAVSTTSGANRKNRVAGEPPRDHRGHRVTSPPDYEYGAAVPGALQLESERITEAVPILPTLRSDQELLESASLRQPVTDYYTKKTAVGPSGDYEGHSITESYSTAAYERNKQQKRPPTLYSDELEEYSPNKQPRVVVLPGERGQEMYTATALQRAAAIAAASAAIVAQASQEENPTSQRGRQILEAAGLVRPEGKDNSIFSRLDSDHPTSSSLPSTSQGLRPQSPPPQTRVAVDTSKVRTIKLGKEPEDDASTPNLKVTSRIRHPSHPDRLSDRLVIGTNRERTSTVPKVTASKSLHSTSTRLSERLGRKDEVSSSKYSVGFETEVPGLRSTASSEATAVKLRLGERTRPHSVVSSSSSVSMRRGASKGREKHSPKLSMVADDYDYQIKRQKDIRSRLEMKEREKAARRSGPLKGRLEKHHVFGRLE